VKSAENLQYNAIVLRDHDCGCHTTSVERSVILFDIRYLRLP